VTLDSTVISFTTLDDRVELTLANGRTETGDILTSVPMALGSLVRRQLHPGEGGASSQRSAGDPWCRAEPSASPGQCQRCAVLRPRLGGRRGTSRRHARCIGICPCAPISLPRRSLGEGGSSIDVRSRGTRRALCRAIPRAFPRHCPRYSAEDLRLDELFEREIRLTTGGRGRVDAAWRCRASDAAARRTGGRAGAGGRGCARPDSSQHDPT
jgi:hypothetical protein